MRVKSRLISYNSITLNKNAVHGDVSALVPGGVRIGTPALTSRGFKEQDVEKVAEFLHRACVLALSIQATSGKMLKDFVANMENNEEVKTLKQEIEAFAKGFPMPGFDPQSVPAQLRH